MVDFCYDKMSSMLKIAGQCKSLLILDHHEKAEQMLMDKEDSFIALGSHFKWWKGYWSWDKMQESEAIAVPLKPKELMIVIDQTHSGAMLAALYTGALNHERWNDDCEGEAFEFVHYIEDRDIWNKRLPGNEEFHCYMGTVPMTLPDWENVYGSVLNELIQAGEGIVKYRQQLIANQVELAQELDFMGMKVLGAPAPYMIASDMAGILAEKSPSKIGVYWVDYPNNVRKFGLRSTPDGPNVSELASKFSNGNGGGHAKAAGMNGWYEMEIVYKEEHDE